MVSLKTNILQRHEIASHPYKYITNIELQSQASNKNNRFHFNEIQSLKSKLWLLSYWIKYAMHLQQTSIGT